MILRASILQVRERQSPEVLLPTQRPSNPSARTPRQGTRCVDRDESRGVSTPKFRPIHRPTRQSVPDFGQQFVRLLPSESEASTNKGKLVRAASCKVLTYESLPVQGTV